MAAVKRPTKQYLLGDWSVWKWLEMLGCVACLLALGAIYVIYFMPAPQ